MKRLLLAFSLYTSVALAQSGEALIADFKSMLLKRGISPVSEQAFCYDEGQGAQGYQVDKLQRIASVTKLFTTYLATENLDLHKRFETKLFISGDKLHIQGSRDPYFEEEKLMLLMSALNRLGYKSFKSVTFDSNFKFYDIALSSHSTITTASTRSRIATYFNNKNTKFINAKWLAAKKFAEEEGIFLDESITPVVQANSVELSEKNPLINLNPTIYTHKSRQLHQIIKSMNVLSKNHVAQNLYLEGNRVKHLNILLEEKGIKSKEFKIYNGSGLPVKIGQSRADNLASCRSVLKLISLLTESIKKHNLKISDILGINGGKDLGTFRERFLNYPETHEAVLSKTGTLMHTSSLAGIIITDNQIPFALLNHTSSVPNAKKFQDSFVARIFHHLGEPLPLDYTKISIFPWDGSEFLELSN